MNDLLVREELLVGSHYRSSTGRETIDAVSPIDEELIARVPAATTDDVDGAVSSARRAFDEGPWPRMSIEERSEYILRLADLLAPRMAAAVELQIREMGAPRAFIGPSTLFVPDWIRRDVAVAMQIPLREVRDGLRGKIVVQREPIGVVAAVLPWNAPVPVIITKLIPSLIAGCPVIVKPAPESPISAYYVADALAEAGLPDGVVSILAAGRDVSEYLVAHPGVDKVSFTGSTVAGRRIGAICGEQVKPVTLELGGKSAAIVLDDADLDRDMGALVAGAMPNNGQVCHATTRILAPASRYAEVVERLVERVRMLKVGDPRENDTDVGPLVAARQRERVEGYIQSGVDQGATLALGGGRPPIPKGWYVEPTIFSNVDNEMQIAQEEIFGPVLAVISYEGEDDAVELANSSMYGLGGAVYTADIERGVDLAARIQTGSCAINGGPHGGGGGPFGGYKRSGVGRERGREGIEAYLHLKSIALPTDYTPS